MADTMQAAVFLGEGRLELLERPVPRLQRRDDVVLRVEAASICGSDIHILNVPADHPATPNIILGHEYAGTILEIGEDVKHVQPGDRVIISPDLRCGHCYYCSIGLASMCKNRTTLGVYIDGGFAPFSLAPARAVFKVSRRIAPDVAAVGEPLACALSGITKVAIQPGDSVVVLGAGPIGMLFALLAKMSGAGQVVVSEPAEPRRRHLQSLGIEHVIDPRSRDLKEFILSITPHGADIVIDAVGSQFGPALDLVRCGGKVLLFGVNTASQTTLNQYAITINQINVIGSFIFANELFPTVIKVLESGALPLDRLITHRFPLAQIWDGVQLLRRGEAVKVIVTP